MASDHGGVAPRAGSVGVDLRLARRGRPAQRVILLDGVERIVEGEEDPSHHLPEIPSKMAKFYLKTIENCLKFQSKKEGILPEG